MAVDFASPHSKQYTYEPLPKDGLLRTRTLALYPGYPVDPLVGRLSCINAGMGELRDCEALSYVWGPPVRAFPLQLENGQLLLTENLYVALRHLRYPDRIRKLWVDAVCINQNDLPERSAQIGRMGFIYSSVHSVIVWLGPDVTMQAMNMFATLRSISTVTARSKQAVRSTMQRVLQCEWFERLWVVQEAIMAQRATIHWGNATIDYATFQRQAREYNQQGPHNQPMWIGEMQHLEGVKTRTILHVIEWTRGMKCSDDRDRLYAILGLKYSSAWSVEAKRVKDAIEPDYTRSVTEIYRDFAAKCIENSLLHKLWLLTSHGSSWNPVVAELPSWAPDLAQGSLPFKLTGSMVSLTEQKDDLIRPFYARPQLDASGRVLLVAGFALGVVSHVEKECIGGASPVQSLCNVAVFWEEQLKSMERRNAAPHFLRRSLRSKGSSPMNESDCWLIKILLTCALPHEDDESRLAWLVENLFDSRAVTMTQSRGPHHCIAMLDALYQSFHATHRHLLRRDTSDPSVSADAYEHVRGVWRCHKLYTTANGKFGIGPLAMNHGDVVALVGGAKHPVILRPHEGHYYLVGNSYVSGIREWEVEKSRKTGWIRPRLKKFEIW